MSENLAEELENDIIFGVYSPGSRITEERVTKRYGATRHAIRSAFAALEARGLIVHRPNKGVEVVEFTPDEVDALYELRLILEEAAALRTPLPSPNETTCKMEEIARQHEKAVQEKDFRAVYRLNQQFHELQYSACGNPRLADLIGYNARAAQPIRVVKYDDSEHMKTIVSQHFDIIKAMRGTSTQNLVAAVRAHLPASAEAYRILYERRYGRTPRV